MALSGVHQTSKSRVPCESLQVLIAPRVEAVFRAQCQGHFEMAESHVHISFERSQYRQSILDMVLPRLELICLAEMFDRPVQISGVQAGDTQGVVLLGRFGSRGGTAGSLAAEAQVQMCPFCHITGIIIHKFFKDFRRLVVIVPLKGPDPYFKTPNRGLVGNVGVCPRRNGSSQSFYALWIPRRRNSNPCLCACGANFCPGCSGLPSNSLTHYRRRFPRPRHGMSFLRLKCFHFNVFGDRSGCPADLPSRLLILSITNLSSWSQIVAITAIVLNKSELTPRSSSPRPALAGL